MRFRLKGFVSLLMLLALVLASHGLVLLLLLLPAGLDVVHAVTRDRRRRYTPFSLTIGLFCLLFLSKPRALPPSPAPVEPVLRGERHSRHIPQDVKIAVSARDGGRCRQCGGTSTVNNIQLLCRGCNLRKADKV